MLGPDVPGLRAGDVVEPLSTERSESPVGAFAPSVVDADRDGLQVPGVDAATVAAEMVEDEVVRDGADAPLVDEPMGCDTVWSTRRASTHRDSPVAGAVPVAGPLPALVVV
jgi:hypothetical protein